MRRVILACCFILSAPWASAQVTPVNLVDSILNIVNNAGSNYSEIITLFRADGTYQDLASFQYMSGGTITTLAPTSGTYTYTTSLQQTWQGSTTVGTISYTSGPNQGQTYQLFFETPNSGQPGSSFQSSSNVFRIYPRLPAGGAENVSNNNWISASHPSTAGFVIGGSNARWVLVRGAGPSLAQFGVQNPVTDPSVTLYDSFSNPLNVFPYTSNNQAFHTWSSDANLGPGLEAAFSLAGAFQFNSNSSDCAALVLLLPGAYTATGSTKTNGGSMLTEVYVLPYGY